MMFNYDYPFTQTPQNYHLFLNDSELSVWLSVDPFAGKYPSLTPYNYCANNPVRLIDPDGMKFINFDSNGNYIGISHDNWWHNLWHGTKGQVLDNSGNAIQTFKFSDPKNDVKSLQAGIVKKVRFVSESEIKLMLGSSGVFDKENKVVNRKLTDRYSFIEKEGKGFGRLDYALNEIPRVFSPDASQDNPDISKALFMIDNVAHNHWNFGNFLIGAAAESMGFYLAEILIGAHYNSLFNTNTNAYGPQLDSGDDQYSIMKGYEYAKKNKYRKLEFRIEIP